MILNRAGENFRSRRGTAIDEHDERHLYSAVTVHGVVASLLGCPAVMRDDQLVLIEEHVRDRDSLVEQASGIAAQVEDEAVELGHVQHLQGGCHITICIFAFESGQTDIPDARPHEKCDVHCMAGNLIARQSEVHRRILAFADHAHAYHRSLGPFEQISDFGGSQALGGLAINYVDDVAWTNAGFRRGRAGHGSKDHGMVLTHADGHAHAVVFAALAFANQCELSRIEEGGVRVEHAQHSGNGAFIKSAIGVDRDGIVLLNDGEHAGQILDVLLQIGGIAGSGPQ